MPGKSSYRGYGNYEQKSNAGKLPEWIRIKRFNRKEYAKTLSIIKENNLNTVCVEADCPNRYECFSSGTATFMILGNICTRKCLYCNIASGKPLPVDYNEAERIRKAAEKLNLSYVVVTSVTRDDLEDGGAELFARVIKEIRALEKTQCREIKTEVLIPDFNGNPAAVEKVIMARPDVINHNIEAAESVFRKVRPKGDYRLSLRIIKKISKSGITAKSGLMVGLGEGFPDIKRTLADLKENGCKIVTIGQYLRPSGSKMEVKKYYTPKEFERIRDVGKKIGLEMIAGPMVRSSYRAEEALRQARERS